MYIEQTEYPENMIFLLLDWKCIKNLNRYPFVNTFLFNVRKDADFKCLLYITFKISSQNNRCDILNFVIINAASKMLLCSLKFIFLLALSAMKYPFNSGTYSEKPHSSMNFFFIFLFHDVQSYLYIFSIQKKSRKYISILILNHEILVVY